MFRVQPYKQGSRESEYSRLFTTYASTFVIKQLKLADKVKISEKMRITLSKHQRERVVSCTGCGCIFHNSMLLPCHMFAMRIKL